MSGNPLLGFVEHGETKGEGSSVQEDDLKKRSTKKVKRDGLVIEDDVCMEEVNASLSSPTVVHVVHKETEGNLAECQAQRSYMDSLMQHTSGEAGWEAHHSDDEELSENRCDDAATAPPVAANGGDAQPSTISGNSNVEGKFVIGDDALTMIPGSSSNPSDYAHTVNPKLPYQKENSPFGLWMMVRRPPRLKGKGISRDPKREESNRENIYPNIASGSRFNALEIDNGSCEDDASGERNIRGMQESCNAAFSSPTAIIVKGNSGNPNIIKVRNPKGSKNPQPKQAQGAQPKPPKMMSKPNPKSTSAASVQKSNTAPSPSVPIVDPSPSLQPSVLGGVPSRDLHGSVLIPPDADPPDSVDAVKQGMEIDECAGKDHAGASGTSINKVCTDDGACTKELELGVVGAGAKTFPNLVNDFIRMYDVSLLGILEPRISGSKADVVCKKIGLDGCVRVEARGFSGGIWVMWKIKMIDFSHSVSEPWCVGGDFNTILFSDEKFGGGLPNRSSMRKFECCLKDCNLEDIGCKGSPFTWQKGDLFERLDRYVANEAWRLAFPNSYVINTPLLASDHHGIWLRLHCDRMLGGKKRKPFKFLAPWLAHPDFDNQVKGMWSLSRGWSSNLQSFTDHLRDWNRDVYGNIFMRKKRIINRLDGIQRELLKRA
ncbi:hypothetical protein RIF29_16430 [Crotalaria pallida]|uniref:Endonuclease/exonuclease/phosphatase domain-containing protein n=1 Tax=Crotalaria pallida TaxID=3830 RepID=A0AAN9IDK1_CROPI